MLRNLNVIVFCIAVAMLFVFVGLPTDRQSNAQEDKTQQASPAPVQPEIVQAACQCDCEARVSALEATTETLRADLDALKKTCGELACKCNEAPKAAPADPAPQAAAPAPPKSMTRSTNGIVLAPGETLVAIDGKPVQSAPMVQRRVVSSGGHWTYPGTISGHLQSDHGVAVQGMSRQEMLTLHDSLHEGTNVPMAPTQNCPNGNCPTAGSPRVPLLFPNLGRKYR